MGNKSNQIATQLEAVSIGGGTSSSASNRLSTKSYAESVGCSVNTSHISYSSNRCVRWQDLSKYVKPNPDPVGDTSAFLDILSVGNTPAERILYAETHIAAYAHATNPYDEYVADVTNTIQPSIFGGYLNERGQSYVALGSPTHDFELYDTNNYYFDNAPIYNYKDSISLSCCTTAFEVYMRVYKNEHLSTMNATLHFATGETENTEDNWIDVMSDNPFAFTFDIPDDRTECLKFISSRGVLYCSNAQVDVHAIDETYKGNILRVVWKPDESLNLNEQLITCVEFDFGYENPYAVFLNYDEVNAEKTQNNVGIDKKLSGMSFMNSLQDMEFIMKTSSSHPDISEIYATVVPMISPWSIDYGDGAPYDVTPLIGCEPVQTPLHHQDSLSFIHDSSICGTINMPYLPFFSVADDGAIITNQTAVGMLDYNELEEFDVLKPDDTNFKNIYHYGFAFKYKVPRPNNGVKERFYLDAIKLGSNLDSYTRFDRLSGYLNFEREFGLLTGDFENGPFGRYLFSNMDFLNGTTDIDVTQFPCGLEGFDFEQLNAIEHELDTAYYNEKLGASSECCKFIQAKTYNRNVDGSEDRIVVVDFTELYKAGYASNIGPLSIFENSSTSPFNTDLVWPLCGDGTGSFFNNLTLIYFSVCYGSHMYSFVLNYNCGAGNMYDDIQLAPYSYAWLYRQKEYYLTNTEIQTKTSQFEMQATVYRLGQINVSTGIYEEKNPTTTDTSNVYGLVNYPYRK